MLTLLFYFSQAIKKTCTKLSPLFSPKTSSVNATKKKFPKSASAASAASATFRNEIRRYLKGESTLRKVNFLRMGDKMKKKKKNTHAQGERKWVDENFWVDDLLTMGMDLCTRWRILVGRHELSSELFPTQQSNMNEFNTKSNYTKNS